MTGKRNQKQQSRAGFGFLVLGLPVPRVCRLAARGIRPAAGEASDPTEPRNQTLQRFGKQECAPIEKKIKIGIDVSGALSHIFIVIMTCGCVPRMWL